MLYVVATVILCLIVAGVYAARLTPVYSASVELILDPRGLLADNSVALSGGASPQEDQSALDSQIYVVLSRAVLDRVVKDLDLTNDTYLLAPAVKAKLDPNDAVAATSGALKEHLSVSRAGQTLVLVITAKHTEARRSADIANAVASTYLRQIDESRAEATSRASNAFQVQASELRDRVLKAETAVEKFKSENGLAQAGSAGLVIDQQVAGLNQQLIAARGVEEQQLTIYEQAERLTLDAIRSGGIPEVLQSQAIGLLRDRYVQLRDRQTQLESSLGSNHPQLRAIRSQVTNLQEALEQELARLRQSMESSYQRAAANTVALQERLESLTRSSFDSGAAQIRLRQLESEAEAVRALYKAFLNRAEELGQQQTLKTNNSRIITSAMPGGGMSKLVKLVILAAGGLFGLILGACLAVLRELLARVTKDRHPEPVIAPAEPEIIAQLPARPQTVRRWRVPFARQAPASETEQHEIQWHAGIQRAAIRLEQEFADQIPATLLLVSSGPLSRLDLVPDLVQAIVDLGYDVRYAPGNFETVRRAARAIERPSLVSALGQEPGNTHLQDQRLRYQYYSGVVQDRRVANRPSFSRYMGTAGATQVLTVINACGTPASDRLAEFAETSDLIVLVREESFDKSRHVLDALGADGERLQGQIVLGG